MITHDGYSKQDRPHKYGCIQQTSSMDTLGAFFIGRGGGGGGGGGGGLVYTYQLSGVVTMNKPV